MIRTLLASILLLLSSLAYAGQIIYTVAGADLEASNIVVIFINDAPTVIHTVETSGKDVTVSFTDVPAGRYTIRAEIYDNRAGLLFETDEVLVSINER